MWRFISTFAIILFWTEVNAQSIKIVSNDYVVLDIDQKVWMDLGKSRKDIFVKDLVPKLSKLGFGPHSHVKLRDNTNKEYREWSNDADTLGSEYACMLDKTFNRPVSYAGLYDAAISVQNQSADSSNLNVVFFDLEDLRSRNKDITVSIAKMNKEDKRSVKGYSRSKAKGFKQKEYISLYVSNSSDLPYYVDAVIKQKEWQTPIIVSDSYNKDSGCDQFILVPPKDAIVILTDIVVWSQVSIELISSNDEFVLTSVGQHPEFVRCSTSAGTKWSIFKNAYSF